MDLIDMIEDLRREKERVERIIATLERLQSPAVLATPEKKRRGRKSMSPEERRDVSERMRKYWADKHNERRHRT
jgi:hypothetical protein